MLPEPIPRSRWIKRLTRFVPLARAACCVLLLWWLGGLTFPSAAATLLWRALPHLGQLVRERGLVAFVAFGGLVALLASCVLLWAALFACLVRFIWSFLLRRHDGAIAFARWLRRPVSIQCVTACSPQAGDPARAVDARQITRATARGNVMACLAVCAEAEANAATGAREACLLIQDACRAAMASAVPDAHSDEMLGTWAMSCMKAMQAAMFSSHRDVGATCRGSAALCLAAGGIVVVALIGQAAAYVLEESEENIFQSVSPVQVDVDLRFLGEAEQQIERFITLSRPLHLSPRLSLILAAGSPLPQADQVAGAWLEEAPDKSALAARIAGDPPVLFTPQPHRAIGIVTPSLAARRSR